MSKVDYEVSERVATLRLNDPGTLNALTGEVVEDMRAAVRRAAAEARALLLCGAGRGFCSGWNLAAPPAGGTGVPDAGLALEAHVNPFMQELRALPIPVVSAVTGAAAGVGASIALAADIVIAGESAYFLQAFRRIGLIPDGGATWLLARAAGRVRAMELMLLGEKLPAFRALEWGLINRIVPDEQVHAAGFELARELAAGPTVALGLIRKAAWAAAEGSFTEALETERRLQTEAGGTEDFREGVAAFLGKRPANFTGN